MLIYRLLAVISRVCGIKEKNSKLQPEMIWNEAHLTIMGYDGYNALGWMFSVNISERLCRNLRTVMSTIFTLNTRSEGQYGYALTTTQSTFWKEVVAIMADYIRRHHPRSARKWVSIRIRTQKRREKSIQYSITYICAQTRKVNVSSWVPLEHILFTPCGKCKPNRCTISLRNKSKFRCMEWERCFLLSTPRTRWTKNWTSQSHDPTIGLLLIIHSQYSLFGGWYLGGVSAKGVFSPWCCWSSYVVNVWTETAVSCVIHAKQLFKERIVCAGGRGSGYNVLGADVQWAGVWWCTVAGVWL